MRTIWNFIIMVFVISLIFYISVGITVVDFAKDKSKEITKSESVIGEKIVLDSDTLTIYDYSAFTNTYTLSNGKKVHKHIVNNNLMP